jgi:adenine-specific DNA methylase
MKYMGSKRAMLTNGLGETIAQEIKKRRRFADLFSGSGVVAWHVAQNFKVEVVASDLQQFAVDLAAAVVCRSRASSHDWIDAWIGRAEKVLAEQAQMKDALDLQKRIGVDSIAIVAQACRQLCREGDGVMFGAYGGYYFSPLQALYLDRLRATLPASAEHSAIAIAALIQAASRCSASPGHTAQPFKPNSTAGPFVIEAWSRPIIQYVKSASLALADAHALIAGQVQRDDALTVAHSLGEGDLVFVDPPYSGVHYSRFYHVLETLALGHSIEVSGTGRYPPADQRPRSDYSTISKSEDALEDLLEVLSGAGCAVIITFPAGEASNGLSGDAVQDIAEQFFRIKSAKVASKFSTLGGNLNNRQARQHAEELILTLLP